MELGFLSWFFFFGIIIATAQDLKRREVDNWLNYFLLLGSFSYVFFLVIFERNFSLVFISFFVLVIMFALMNLFYYGRVFGGGDAFLLFAMSALFVGTSYIGSAISVGIFVALLMISGSVYGLSYSLYLYGKNFKKVNREMKRYFSKSRNIFFFSILAGIFFFLLSCFYFIFLFFAVIFILFPFLYVFGRGLENVSMIREISTTKLREGDWLANDERVGNKTVKMNWEGLSMEEIRILRKKKIVKIKEGIPFVPAFLIGFVLYILARGWILGLL